MVHHCRGLRQLLEKEGLETDQIDQLLSDLKTEPLAAQTGKADAALLKYAIKLTRQPASVKEADIEELRREGFDDRAIHDLVCCVSYFAFVNRIADGLGVTLES